MHTVTSYHRPFFLDRPWLHNEREHWSIRSILTSSISSLADLYLGPPSHGAFQWRSWTFLSFLCIHIKVKINYHQRQGEVLALFVLVDKNWYLFCVLNGTPGYNCGDKWFLHGLRHTRICYRATIQTWIHSHLEKNILAHWVILTNKNTKMIITVYI